MCQSLRSCNWLWISVVMVLATLAGLAVPPTALADDAGDWCTFYCNDFCAGKGKTCMMSCWATCYNGYSNGCDSCSGLSGDAYTECIAGCTEAISAAAPCKIGYCEVSGFNRCNLTDPNDDPPCAGGECSTAAPNCSGSCECRYTIVLSSVKCWCQK
jgi:hypothetical protein